MGAWSYDIFDDDIAYDFFDKIKIDARSFFESSFNHAIQSDYLGDDEGHAVTVSAAYIDNHINGTKYRTDNHNEFDITNVNLFQELRPNLELNDLTDLAIQALEKVLSDNSELNELWYQNEELYPKWRANIQALIDRLQ